MTAYVVVVHAARPGEDSARQSPLSGSGQFQKALKRHGATVLFGAKTAAPGNAPSDLTIQTPDIEQANRLAEAIRGMPGVETAYVKPGEELP